MGSLAVAGRPPVRASDSSSFSPSSWQSHATSSCSSLGSSKNCMPQGWHGPAQPVTSRGRWPLVVAGSAAVLVTAPPGGPAQPVRGIQERLDDQDGEQAGDLVSGQRHLPVGRRIAGVV